jgi:hypothetical protein
LSILIEELEQAIRMLEPPFLGLPEHGWTPERLAYRRGARDAYAAVLEALRGVQAPEAITIAPSRQPPPE